MQRDKEGFEIDHGIFVSATSPIPAAGTSSLPRDAATPRRDAIDRLPELNAEAAVDLGAAEIFRKGRASHVIEKNPRHLNAEDATTIDAAEIAVDLAILDPHTQIGVLRGDYVQGGKYHGSACSAAAST